MTKIFQIFPTFDPLHSVLSDCDYRLDEIDPSDLAAGRDVSPGAVAKVRFGVTVGASNPIYLSNIIGWPVFQRKFVEKAGWIQEGNEVFAVNEKSGRLTDYWVLRVRNYLDIIDFERSDIEFFEDGGIEFVSRLVLRLENFPRGVSIFRLKDYPWPLFVTDAIERLVLCEAGLGFTLRRVPLRD